MKEERVSEKKKFVEELPAEIPLEMMVLRVLRPMWIILVPVSACCLWLVSATE